MPKHTASVIAIVAAIGFSPTAASAADIAPAAYDWSGFYFGVNAGMAWNNSEVNGEVDCLLDGSPCPDPDDIAENTRQSIKDNNNAFSGGAMIGANWQWESFVLGVEADVNYAGFDERNGSSVFDLPGPSYFISEAELESNWWGTVRGRMGFAADNWLFYGTGGLAWGVVDASAGLDNCADQSCSPGILSRGSVSDTMIGWTIGAGLEYGWDNWTMGAEYLYVDLGSTDFDYDISYINSTPGPSTSFSGDATVDYRFSVVRATLKYRF